jgi:hypothetical protein
MRKRHLGLLPPSIGFLTLSLFLSAIALAGPPLICHAFDIGSAKSLPWMSHSWNLTGNETYDTSRLATDTLAILESDSTALVHMETLRRATLYARNDPAAAKNLFTAVVMLTKSAQPSGRSQALVYFDAGYLAEAYKQWLGEKGQNPAGRVDGYALVKEAIRLRGSDPQMEFAAALITLSGQQSERQDHVQKAMAGAKTDPLLARNLACRFHGDQGETVSEMLNKTAIAKE